MPDELSASVRPWREVAAELTHETDEAKVAALLLELDRALEERDKDVLQT